MDHYVLVYEQKARTWSVESREKKFEARKSFLADDLQPARDVLLDE